MLEFPAPGTRTELGIVIMEVLLIVLTYLRGANACKRRSKGTCQTLSEGGAGKASRDVLQIMITWSMAQSIPAQLEPGALHEIWH